MERNSARKKLNLSNVQVVSCLRSTMKIHACACLRLNASEVVKGASSSTRENYASAYRKLKSTLWVNARATTHQTFSRRAKSRTWPSNLMHVELCSSKARTTDGPLGTTTVCSRWARPLNRTIGRGKFVITSSLPFSQMPIVRITILKIFSPCVI